MEKLYAVYYGNKASVGIEIVECEVLKEENGEFFGIDGLGRLRWGYNDYKKAEQRKEYLENIAKELYIK